MAIQRRKFSEAEKINILNSAERLGVTAVLREHRLSYSVYNRWKQAYGAAVRKAAGIVKPERTRSEFKRLMDENTQLKKIIADQALEIERKEEELRKNNPSYGKR